jgi:uncharacterized membrane protein YfcA
VSTADYATLAALAAIAFGGAFIFGVTGFGSALLTIPLATHLVPLPFALAMFSVLDCTSAWRIGLNDPKSALAAEWKRILPGVVVGTVVGMTILVNLPRAVSMAALGVFVLAIAVSNIVRASAVGMVRQAWAYAAGLAGGITSTLFGAGGPPYAIYLSRRPLSKEQYRSTLGVCTMFSISLRVVAFLIAGPLQSATPWLYALAALPASFAGLWLASKAFARFSRDTLMRAIGFMLAASGISLIVRALAA